ncbi:acetate/propionate family kinase [Herminiimonas fonticola]|uniref:Acetate kinase n=1 Tax=Herminiimonas fonticola TaxID=303380 RepID=A0A4R6G2K3_9BURK|nr:acetate/propionate family kinase [Herminiimonas fonticola]RBA23624.1 ackA: acetate kinase [Herminiimonas fonticola]TDN88030.1 acetate kinase [Herminiimonas fonticola]
MNACVLVLNCGSSSIKFALFDADLPLERVPLWSGKTDDITGPAPTFEASDTPPERLNVDAQAPYHSALQQIKQRAIRRLGGIHLVAVVHRVVHGGARYFGPVRVDQVVLADLRNYIPLAPLHQPFALEAIESFLQMQPKLLQIACFDTAFHHTLPRVEKMLPLPYSAWERGIQRYGFHGLSYQYISIVLPERHGDLAHGKVIVAHLGSGASLCGMQNLRSVATTMGFSALDGLMMGTRCGALDPGVLLYLMEVEQLSPQQLGHVLYYESGLLGISGVSSDPRALLQIEIDNPRVRDALALYVQRIVREIGALTAVLGGLDLLVFTAGIGENNAEMRARICKELHFLGLILDDSANQSACQLISTSQSRVAVAIEPTNEEWMAANLAHALLPKF